MRNDRTKRILTVLLIIAVCLAMLFSVCFLACSSHHDCTGEDCVICMQISLCESILRTLSQTAAAVSFVGAAVYLAVSVSSDAKDQTGAASLVVLRVKLSD